MSLPAPSPRPERSPADRGRRPFRVVLPDSDLESSREAALPASPPGDFPLVIADTPETVETEPSDLVLPQSPVPTPESESEPRGVVILEQVLGRRDPQGRPLTFGRRLRHRLFGLALGLTLVSGAGLIIGFVGDIDQKLLPLPIEIEALGTSAIPDLEESQPPLIRNLLDQLPEPGEEDVAGSVQRAADAAEQQAVESSDTPGVWFEGGIEESTDDERDDSPIATPLDDPSDTDSQSPTEDSQP